MAIVVSLSPTPITRPGALPVVTLDSITVPIIYVPGIVATNVRPATAVTYDGELYVCTVAHTTTDVFDPAKWLKIVNRGADSASNGAAEIERRLLEQYLGSFPDDNAALAFAAAQTPPIELVTGASYWNEVDLVQMVWDGTATPPAFVRQDALALAAAQNASADAAAAAASAAAADAASALRITNIPTAADTGSASPISAPTLYWMKEYATAGANGGGQLIYNPTSTATVNNGTVFAAPAGIGRFIRPIDGVLHSNWFGLKDSTSLDQSARFQAFLNEAIGNSYTAYIDPGYIDCNGAQIYLNNTWSGNTARPGGGSGGTAAGGPLHGFKLVSANRRWAQIGHVLLHLGAVGAFGNDGLASGSMILEEVYLDRGGYVLWSCEVATMLKNCRAYVGSGCDATFDVPSTGSPGTIATTGFATHAGLFAYGVNQLSLFNTRAECPTTVTSLNYVGMWFDGCTNVYWNGGGVNTCGKGAVLKQAGLEFSQASLNFVGRDLHFESNIQESVYVEDAVSMRLQGHFRGSDTATNGAWDRANYPVIRIGNASAAVAPAGVTIANSYFVGKTDLNATAIRLEKGTELAVVDNAIRTFVNGVDMWSGASLVAPVARNNFASVANDVLRDQQATYSVLPARERAGQALTDGANVIWRVSSTPNANLTIAAPSTRTLNAPTGPVEGLTYRLIVKKSNASGALAFNAVYIFPGGTAPDIASMTTSQQCKIEFYYDGTNMIGRYDIY